MRPAPRTSCDRGPPREKTFGIESLLGHARHGGIDVASIPRFVMLAAEMTLARLVRAWERAAEHPQPSPPPPIDPVFIVGHYRSGTTLLHKLLASDPRFGTVDTFDLLLPSCPLRLKPVLRRTLQRLVDLLRIEQPFFHQSALRLEDPNELEPLLLSQGAAISVYWGFLFPRDARALLDRWILLSDPLDRRRWKVEYRDAVERVRRRTGRRRLVLKDPANTGRVATLRELYPEAFFIKLDRRTDEVLASMDRLWRDTIQPRFSLQRISQECQEEVVRHHHRILSDRWAAESASIPEEHLATVRYDDLVGDPLAVLDELYDRMGLELAPAREALEARALRERGYRPWAPPEEPPRTPSHRAPR